MQPREVRRATHIRALRRPTVRPDVTRHTLVTKAADRVAKEGWFALAARNMGGERIHNRDKHSATEDIASFVSYTKRAFRGSMPEATEMHYLRTQSKASA